MTEIISRKDDENLYQPKIHSQRIRELHQIVEQSGQPMTVLVDLALRRFVEENRPLLSPLGGTLQENLCLDMPVERGSDVV